MRGNILQAVRYLRQIRPNMTRLNRRRCLKYFQKVFQLQMTKYILKCVSITFVNYFGRGDQNTKCKILLQKVIEIQNTFRSHYESISQSINECSFNKQEKHTHISWLGIGCVG